MSTIYLFGRETNVSPTLAAWRVSLAGFFWVGWQLFPSSLISITAKQTAAAARRTSISRPGGFQLTTWRARIISTVAT